MLTILASYAQEESLSVSENMKWRIKKNFEDGRLVKQALSDHTEIDAELRRIAEEMEVVAGLIEKSIATNAITALDQLEYTKTYESLTEKIWGFAEELYGSYKAESRKGIQGGYPQRIPI